jgi:hypothetical protein
MRKRVFLLLPLLAAMVAGARERPANWIEVHSPGFTVVSNSSEKQGRRIAAQFERMRAIFQQAYPQLGDDAEAPVLVLAVRNNDEFRKLQPRAYLAKKSLPLHGMFVRASGKDYILMRLDSQAGNPYPLVYHEYTHVFLREGEERIPLWLNEGLAEFYQSTEIYDRDVLLGEPNQQHLMLLRQEELLPLPTLFTVDETSPYYLEEKKGALFYAECWALTHYLTLKDNGDKTSKVPQYINLVNEGIDPITAAARAFGDLRKLQRNLELYLEQSSFNHFETKLSRKIDDAHFIAEPMTSAQAKSVEADYLAASGRIEDARALAPSIKQENVSATVMPTGTSPTQLEPKRSADPPDDLSCPLADILHGASERASEMVENLQRLTATEQIEHTEFKRNGRPRQSTNQLFNYVAEIAQGSAGSFWVEEYRAEKTQADPPPLSDTGTAAFALIFHPQKIGNFEFHCEGYTEFHGFPAWQLRFKENADPRKSFHQIRIDRSAYQLRFQGHAWIADKDSQILRLLTDLVAPIPQIHLKEEHLDISYAPVGFEKPRFLVWLPEEASMQISYRGHRYQRVHKFSHFQLFLVVTEQTVKEPIPGPGG